MPATENKIWVGQGEATKIEATFTPPESLPHETDTVRTELLINGIVWSTQDASYRII